MRALWLLLVAGCGTRHVQTARVEHDEVETMLTERVVDELAVNLAEQLRLPHHANVLVSRERLGERV